MIEKIANYIKEQSKWFWLTILFTIIVDTVNTMYFETVQAFFFNILEGKDTKAIISLTAIYALFIILLILIGMMSSYGERSYRTKKQNGIQKFAGFMSVLMIFGYGIILMMPAINILALADSASNFSDDQQYTYFMILLALFFIMIVFAFIELKTRFVLGKLNYLYIYVPVLILTILFVDLSTAVWKFQLFEPDKIIDPNRGSRVIEFIAIFPLYAIFFSAPRFILLRKSYSILPILSAIFSTAYFVWKSLEYIEL